MTELVRYDEMCRAIAECDAVDEVKDLRDKVMAMEHYAKQALDHESEHKVIRIRLRAERRMGQLLKETEKAPRGPDNRGQGSQRATSDAKTLKDMGVSKDQSNTHEKSSATSNGATTARGRRRSRDGRR